MKPISGGLFNRLALPAATDTCWLRRRLVETC
jgi:hypothetical protein